MSKWFHFRKYHQIPTSYLAILYAKLNCNKLINYVSRLALPHMVMRTAWTVTLEYTVAWVVQPKYELSWQSLQSCIGELLGLMRKQHSWKMVGLNVTSTTSICIWTYEFECKMAAPIRWNHVQTWSTTFISHTTIILLNEKWKIGFDRYKNCSWSTHHWRKWINGAFSY